jgi:hypothetical protein
MYFLPCPLKIVQLLLILADYSVSQNSGRRELRPVRADYSLGKSEVANDVCNKKTTTGREQQGIKSVVRRSKSRGPGLDRQSGNDFKRRSLQNIHQLGDETDKSEHSATLQLWFDFSRSTYDILMKSGDEKSKLTEMEMLLANYDKKMKEIEKDANETMEKNENAKQLDLEQKIADDLPVPIDQSNIRPADVPEVAATVVG